MVEEQLTKEQEQAEIRLLNRRVQQLKKDLDLIQKEHAIKTKIFEYEINNCEMVGDKPKFLTESQYYKLMAELKQYNLEIYELQYADNLSATNQGIIDCEKKITELSLNHKVEVSKE